MSAVQRALDAAKRLVEHADFQLGGVLSADSKSIDIPSKAVSQVKARHLASLRDALTNLKTEIAQEVEPVAYEVFPIKFANGTKLVYDKPVNLPGYISYRPLFAAPQAVNAELLEALKRCKFDSLNMSLDDLAFCRAAIAKAGAQS